MIWHRLLHYFWTVKKKLVAPFSHLYLPPKMPTPSMTESVAVVE